jgi:tRNA(Ile)-lysidine synthase
MSKKDLNVLNLAKKVNLKTKHLPIYLNFKLILSNFLKSRPFVVAVSGGADSLALTVLSSIYKREKKNKIYYVLVDHKLRKNSSVEANSVKKLLKQNKINLFILTNKKKIDKNIQSNAREVRYKLLEDFCKKKLVKFILTGHHRDDQIETFLIRLSRGSGVQGLSSMKKITKLKNNIKLFRPFLNEKKIDLANIAKNFFGKIFKDPSNFDKKYLRIKIRSLITQFEKKGIKLDQIIKSINNLGSTRDTLNNYITRVEDKLVISKNRKISIKLDKFFLEPGEIQMKIISRQIKYVSKSYYPPRASKLLNLIKRIKFNKKCKYTLGGCVILRNDNHLNIYKEI